MSDLSHSIVDLLHVPLRRLRYALTHGSISQAWTPRKYGTFAPLTEIATDMEINMEAVAS